MAVGTENTVAAAADKGGGILKPRTDKREYRRVVLKNSLKVLLISDPETDKCAASMNVSVGSFSDPEGLDGLAHFLEHMLFYASEKYPEEDSYSKFITEHGGSTNAYTSSEDTNYHFDINTDSFDEALDRFAQFFIKPLMLADATMREIKAVDSENQKNLLSDSWRMRQLQKHLSREDHPYHKFGTGNMDTLHVRPEAKGMDTRSELIKFYDKHYSANIMNLVVYGKESLDKTQGLVEEMFQEIRNTNKDIPSFPGQPCTPDHLQVLVKAVPIRHGHKLTVSWPVTPSIHHYEEAPCRYLGHLIGHEGEGSLFHALKTLGWATGLYAGEGDWTMEYSFFDVSVDLTDAGHEHMQDILGLLFRHIKLLQQSGVSQWIFDELSAICEAEFHYQAKIDPISYAVDISSNMTIYPTKHWLVGSSLPSEFNPAIVKKILNELSPSNVRIFWKSNKFEGQTDKVEPWYKTAYSFENITESTIQERVQSAPDVNLVLPTPNVFIPTDLSLKDVQDKEIFPVLLRKTSFSRLWYKPDTKFFKPKAYVKIDFNCPLAVTSPDAVVLSNTFVWLLVDCLNEYAYYAQVAGLDYGLSLSDNGFELYLVGFNHKLRIFLEAVMQKIAKFEVKPDRFSVIKETITKAYQNYKFQQPYHQALSYCSMVLQDHTWPWTEERDALSHMEAEDLVNFVPMLLSRTFVECYIAGTNIIHVPLANLKKMDLTCSSHLKELPDLSNATNVETLVLSYCENLVELPSSISNLQKLKRLSMQSCTKLEVIPTNWNLKSLQSVDITGTNIATCDISVTSLKEEPASFTLGYGRPYLFLSLRSSGKLMTLTQLPENLSTLDLSYSGIERISNCCIKGLYMLRTFKLSCCTRLTSLPELPASLEFLDADDCESLETIFCPLDTTNVNLNFTNCFNLGQEARREIIQQRHRRFIQYGSSYLPGSDMPKEFHHRAVGNTLAFPLPAFSYFKVCLVISLNQKTGEEDDPYVFCRRIRKGYLYPIEEVQIFRIPSTCQTKHLFIFSSEALDETECSEFSRDMTFEFSSKFQDFDITECGVQIMTYEDDGSDNEGLGDEDGGSDTRESVEPSDEQEDKNDGITVETSESESKEVSDDEEGYTEDIAEGDNEYVSRKRPRETTMTIASTDRKLGSVKRTKFSRKVN